jgi:hypothetical protein
MDKNNLNFLRNSRPHNLVLGEDYIVWYGQKPELCKFIQPTEKGFNFLNLDTSKCILKRHLYPSKKIGTGSTFFIHSFISILKHQKVA